MMKVLIWLVQVLSFFIIKFHISDTYPTSDDLSFNCSGRMNRENANYDIIVSPVMFSEAFTPVIRESIEGFQGNIVELDHLENLTLLSVIRLQATSTNVQVIQNVPPVRNRGNYFELGVSNVY